MMLLGRIAVASAWVLLSTPLGAAQGTQAVDGRLRDARAQLKSGDLDSAQRAVESVLESTPRPVAALLLLGEILDARKDLNGAVAAYEQAISASPRDAVAHDKLGLALGRLDRVTEAIASFARAVELNPRLFDAQYHLGAARWFTRDFDGAEARSADAHYMLGTVLRQQGRRDEAIVEFRQAIEFEPDLSEAHQSLAQALQQQGDAPGARSAQAEADRLNRRKADQQASTFAVSVGQEMLKRGDRGGAISQFREAVRLDGDNAAAHQALAQALQQAGAVQEAKRHFDEARRLSRRTRSPETPR